MIKHGEVEVGRLKPKRTENKVVEAVDYYCDDEEREKR